jgi:hypothetical protein
MTDYLEKVSNLVPDFKSEVIAIQTSVQNLITSEKIAKPFYIPFDLDDKKPFVSFIRDWDVNNHIDYYSAINEMLFTYPSINPKVFLFAVHPESNPFFNVNNSFDFADKDNLIIFVISSEIALAVEMKYTHDFSSNTVVWSDEFTCTEVVDVKDPIVESFYTYSHIDEPTFSYKEILNYLSRNNTHLMIVDDKAKVNLYHSISKGPYSPSLLV